MVIKLGDYSLMIPLLAASASASVLPLTASLLKMWMRWVLTVMRALDADLKVTRSRRSSSKEQGDLVPTTALPRVVVRWVRHPTQTCQMAR